MQRHQLVLRLAEEHQELRDRAGFGPRAARTLDPSLDGWERSAEPLVAATDGFSGADASGRKTRT
ncbi:MAG: hypothetical protein KDB61_15425, partial [Planctomycetes bacterium]|nr:hypothetical protein [Planctomycetota bacterium]